MEMDWKGNMAELGGAFMLSWVVLGTESDIGTLIGAATLAVAWMAFSGAHLLPIVTWCHMMTGDLADQDNWMNNGMRLVFQALGALAAVLLATEAGSMEGLPDFTHSEMWVKTMGDQMWAVIGMMAAGAVWWQIHTRCNSEWASAFALMALGGAMTLDGAHQMGSMLADGGTQVADVAVDWIMNGLVVGLGAFIGMKIDEMIPDGDDASAE